MQDNIGENIKVARKAKGLTQRDLGEKIGKKYSTVQKYENGLIEPPISVIEEIAAVLEVDPYSLMSWDQATKALEDDINAGIDARTRLEAAFDRLTREGKKLVANVAEILASHPDYRQVMEESPARAGKDTTPPQNAPETPPEGK